MTLAGLASAVASETGRRSLVERLVAGMPGLGVCVVGSLAWAAAMAAGVSAHLMLAGWLTPEAILRVATVHAAGGLLAFPIAYTAAGLFRERPAETRMAAALLAFTFATIACTAAVYALEYRRYYAEWHGDPFTARWAVEFAYTVAGALGQFAISGIRMYFPFGFAALLVVSAWFARRRR